MAERKKRILIVDDDEKLRQSTSRRLTILGFDSLTAVNGVAAIEIAMHQPIDLAIVDLLMPDMNGLVTITKLKEIHIHLRTILLTGHRNDKVRAATQGLKSRYFEKEEMNKFWGSCAEACSGWISAWQRREWRPAGISKTPLTSRRGVSENGAAIHLRPAGSGMTGEPTTRLAKNDGDINQT